MAATGPEIGDMLEDARRDSEYSTARLRLRQALTLLTTDIRQQAELIRETNGSSTPASHAASQIDELARQIDHAVAEWQQQGGKNG